MDQWNGVMMAAYIYSMAVGFTCGLETEGPDSEPLYKTEHRLKKFLLTDYDKTTTPQTGRKEPIKLQLGLAIIDIENLDEAKGALTTQVWMRMSWSDTRLMWNRSEYNELDHVTIPYDDIWRPDIVPYNYAGDRFSFNSHYKPVVDDHGVVLYIPHTRLQTKCVVNLEAYPFDEQKCSIKLGSWTTSGNIMTIERYYDQQVDTRDLQPSNEWDLVNATDIINIKYYPCCTEGYYDYTVNLTLHRHSHILVHMYVGPGVCLGLMIPVIFMLPAFSTYKLILGGTLLIAQVLMMNQLADSLPTSHVTAPTISLYMLANIVLLSLSLACSTVIIYCWEKAKKGGVGVPAGISKVFVGIFGRLMCVRREDYIDDSDTVGAPNNVISDNADVQTDDSAAIVKEYTRLVAPAEWRQLSVVCDRLLFVMFVLITVITMAAMVKYSY